MKQVHAPHLGRAVKLGGRRPPVAQCPRLHLRSYLLRAGLPVAPSSVDYSSAAMAALSLVYDNDSLGDCVIAGGYHVIGTVTGNADGGSPFIATDAQIIADYGAIGGYNPADPSTDQGCDEQTALNYWTQKGFADGSKLAGWAAVNAGDQAEVMAALYLFENVYFGVSLPDAWINPFPSASGFTWDVGTPDPSNGHCFIGVGYSTAGVLIDTWGLLGTVTWAAVAALCAFGVGELYTLLTPDQLTKGASKAPNGVAWADLTADLASLNGQAPPPPPAPNPSPPAGTLSLMQAQAALAAGWPL